MFLIIYVRVIDNKKDGLKMDGPFYGSEHPTMQSAHTKCRKLTGATKDHILIKVYDLNKINYFEAKKASALHFDRIYSNMQTARLLCDTPKRKK